MKTLLCVLLLAAVAGAITADVDVTGNWSGSYTMSGPNGEAQETPALFVLKQTGKDITGTVGPDEGKQFAIQKGKIDGDKITLEVDHDGHIIKLDLVVAADRIKGEANIAAEGQSMKGKIDVTRAK